MSIASEEKELVTSYMHDVAPDRTDDLWEYWSENGLTEDDLEEVEYNNGTRNRPKSLEASEKKVNAFVREYARAWARPQQED